MSYQNFEKALELAKTCEDYDIGTEKSEAIIEKASLLLGLKFSKQNYQFFSQLGYLEFCGTEIYGILKDDFSGRYVGCAVEATLSDRKELNLPKEWLTIYDYSDGYMCYLDYSRLNEEGEPPVIMAIYNGERYIEVEKVADDLGDFILMLVEEQLARQ